MKFFKLFLSFLIIIFLIFLNYLTGWAENYTYGNYKDIDGIVAENERILFILDFSNSMNEILEGQKKKDLMLATINKILPTINPNIWVGLRVYGHRIGLTQSDACLSSALVNPIMPANGCNIQKSLSGLRAVGMTPITYSLKRAIAKDFSGFVGQKHIILLTDGGENCDESPCKYIMQVIRYQKNIKIDVIAFDLDSETDINQLRCVALVTSGKFYTVNTSAELTESLSNSLNAVKSVDVKIVK